MLARLFSATLHGLDATLVEVEVDRAQGLPNLQIVGLPEMAVREASKRVLSAIRNSGYDLVNKNRTVNLAPADQKKSGSGYDLPIALGLLAAEGILPPDSLGDTVVLGELALDGRVKAVRGILPAAIEVGRRGCRRLLVPKKNAREAGLVPSLEVHGISSLGGAVELLAGRTVSLAVRTDPEELLRAGRGEPWDGDLAEVRGQEHARRALEVAAAGAHNVLLLGPPGAGKTMLARRLPTILPDLTLDEALATTGIYSVAGLLDGSPLVTARPMRAPHHTISTVGLVGGGPWLRPGEISLAHHGVLFLDELPEFRRGSLEVLRQPLEEGTVRIARARGTVTYPARFVLVGAMNPCPCGFDGDPRRECTCAEGEIRRYRGRISGPLLDRIDLHIEMPAVPAEDLARKESGEPSANVRERVVAARRIQNERYKSVSAISTNADLPGGLLDRFAPIPPDARDLLVRAIERLGLSARTWTRVRRVSRTLADLAGRERITTPDVAEALQYSTLDRR